MKRIVLISLASLVVIGSLVALFTRDKIGATSQVAGQTYTLAGSGTTASASSFTLTSLTYTQTGQTVLDSHLSDTFYVTFEPGNRTKQEIAACTTITQNGNGTATISGCSRGMLPFTPFTASTTYAFSHAGGTSVIFSDPPQLFNQYPAKDNAEVVTGQWRYDSYPTVTSSLSVATTTYQLVTKQYADMIANQGAATSTEDVAGIVELATQDELPLSTDYGALRPLVLQAKYATSTGPGAGGIAGYHLVVTDSDGYLSSSFGGKAFGIANLDGNQAVYQNPASARETASTSSIPITSATTSTLDRSWIPYKFGGDGSDGMLNLTSGTTTIDLSNTSTLIKNYTSINISAGASLVFINPSSTGSVVVLKSQGATTIAGSVFVTSTGGAGGAARSGSTGAGSNGTSQTIFTNITTYGAGAAASDAGAGGGISVSSTLSFGKSSLFRRYTDLFVGAGGGSGNIENNASGDDFSGFGGRGAGALVIESNGALNFTGTIYANGQNGGNGFTNESPGGAGGGGGGGGGYVRMLYQSLVAQSGTINVSGGTGGTCSIPNPGTVAGGGGGGSATAGNAGQADVGNGSQCGGNGGTGVGIIEKNEFYY